MEDMEIQTPKRVKKPKRNLKVKNDPSKGSSFWVVEKIGDNESLLFSGNILECKTYIDLASKNLIM
jgi:hypothetical protein